LKSSFGGEVRDLTVLGRFFAKLENIVVFEGLDGIGPALPRGISHDHLEVKITDSHSLLLLGMAFVLSIGIAVTLAHEGFSFD